MADSTTVQSGLATLTASGVMSAAECAASAGIDVRGVRAYLRRAINAGLVGIRPIAVKRSAYVALSRAASVWDYAAKTGLQ